MTNRFLNNITINDEYTLPSADGTADQIITTDGAGQLSFVDQSTISAGNAEHVVIYAKNTHTASIAKGTPVYITGTVGATDTVEIAPADASNSAKMPAVGLLDDTLAVNDFGYVITGGFMDNITTDPIDGATPSSNDTVYVKAGGGLTLTKPTGSNLIQNVAKVGKVSGGNSGSLIVSSILRTNDVPNLTTGKIWVGTANNTAESTVVHLDEANNRLGVNDITPSYTLDVSGTLRSTGYAYFATAGSTSIAQLGGGSTTTSQFNILSTASGNSYIAATNTLSLKANNTTAIKIDNTGNVGIGTTSPSEKLFVNGGNIKAENTSTVYLKLNSNTIYPSVQIQAERQGGQSPPMGQLRWDSNPGAVGMQLHYWNSYTENSLKLDGSNFIVTNNGSERMRITSTGNVGIGQTNPAYKLDVNGTGRFSSTLTAQTNMYLGGLIYHSGDTNTFFGFPSNDTFKIRTNNSDRIYVNSAGNVGIGTTGPNAKLDVAGDIFGAGNVEFEGGDTILIRNKPNLGGKLVTVWDHTKDKIYFGDLEGGYSGSSLTIDYKNEIIATAKFSIGIGNSSPSYLLDVNGDGRVDGTFTCVTLVQTSQRDQKENISDIDKSKPKAIPFKEYTYKSSIDGSARKRYGVIAEDIENDYPELVHIGADGIKGVNYIDLLVKRVAELEKELEDISLTPGPKGDTGATGATGPQGPAGNDGKNGSDGSNATIPILDCKGGEYGVLGSIQVCEGNITFSVMDPKEGKQIDSFTVIMK